jgi:hypothetical protein
MEWKGEGNHEFDLNIFQFLTGFAFVIALVFPSPIQLQILKKTFGSNSLFQVIDSKFSGQEFSSKSLIKLKKMKATNYIAEPNLLIKISPSGCSIVEGIGNR